MTNEIIGSVLGAIVGMLAFVAYQLGKLKTETKGHNVRLDKVNKRLNSYNLKLTKVTKKIGGI